MSVFATLSGMQSSALRMAGITAVSLAANLTSATALAQDARDSGGDRYSPAPSASYNPYRPEPRLPYVFDSTHQNQSVDGVTRHDSPSSAISESIPWWEERDGRLGIFAVFSAIVIGFALAGLHLIHKHKDEIDNRPS